MLPGPEDDGRPNVTLDLYSRLQSVASDGATAGRGTERSLTSLKPHAAFFDAARVHDRLLRRKRQKGWRNLVIPRRTVERLLQSDDWYELYLPPERLHATRFRKARGLEDVAVDLITEYADRFWRRQRRSWEHDRVAVVTLDTDDPNNAVAYELSVDSAENLLVRDAGGLAATMREGRYGELKDWYENLKVGVIRARKHAYQPLFYAGKDRVVTVQPVPLDENEKRVVEGLERLARKDDPCLQGRELFLIRNLTRGRGVSFFDDFGYYPDFIVWLKEGERQHVLFLDPKGLSRFGRREREKVQLHRNMTEIEEQVRRVDPNLRLGAYVLSVTPAADIGDRGRSVSDWKADGVYFLNESDCLEQVIRHALQSAA